MLFTESVAFPFKNKDGIAGTTIYWPYITAENIFFFFQAPVHKTALETSPLVLQLISPSHAGNDYGTLLKIHFYISKQPGFCLEYEQKKSNTYIKGGIQVVSRDKRIERLGLASFGWPLLGSFDIVLQLVKKTTVQTTYSTHNLKGKYLYY